jgi:peroxin-13
LIESIVGAVGGFAQMLESTYMATHSSFFAMVSVAEQFGHLKNSLGSILGIFALMRYARKFVATISGKQGLSEVAGHITATDFAKFNSKGPKRPQPSFKPLVIFLAAVFGLPYLLSKLIRSVAARQENRLLMDTNGGAVNGTGNVIDPSQLEFCRALYDFVPENPQVELELRKGDLVAILTRNDPLGNPSQWWRVRTRDGKSGYIPSTYVELIPKRLQDPKLKEIKDDLSVEEFKKTVS